MISGNFYLFSAQTQPSPPGHGDIPVVLHVVRPHLLAERVQLPPLRGLQQLRRVRDPAGTAVHGDQPGGYFCWEKWWEHPGKIMIFPDPNKKCWEKWWENQPWGGKMMMDMLGKWWEKHDEMEKRLGNIWLGTNFDQLWTHVLMISWVSAAVSSDLWFHMVL